MAFCNIVLKRFVEVREEDQYQEAVILDLVNLGSIMLVGIVVGVMAMIVLNGNVDVVLNVAATVVIAAPGLAAAALGLFFCFLCVTD